MSYSVRINGNVFGPFDESQLLEMKSKGKISRVTEISESGGGWQAAEMFPFLYVHTAPVPTQSSVSVLADRFHRANAAARYEEPVSGQPEPEYEPGVEFTAEMRLNGKLVSITRRELFELARAGSVLPDDLLTINGAKVFADSIKGIVFGDTLTLANPSSIITPDAKPRGLANFGKHVAINSPSAAGKPFYSVPPQKDEDESGYSLRSLLDWFYESVERYSVRKSIIVACCILGVILLLGTGLFFLSGNQNKYGTVNIEGTVTLDGEPMSGVSVILHPRDGNGSVAGGITTRGGKFTVTTDIVVDPTNPLRGTVPMVRGALPGDYDVTFYKLKESNHGILTLGNRPVPEYEVPQRYGDVKTSGLEPIRIQQKGTRRFEFGLTTADTDRKQPNN